jgi:GAF domain-containing protein
MTVGGKADTTSRTSARVEQAHTSQVELNEGPCLDVIREGASTYRCDETATDPRWPVWGPHASKLGYRSVLSVRLATNDRKFGSLNAYSAEPRAFKVEDERTMEFLAAHASVAIAATQRDRHYLTALDSRSVIGQAQGMIMATFDLDADAAFQFMRRISQDSNRQARDHRARDRRQPPGTPRAPLRRREQDLGGQTACVCLLKRDGPS